MRAGRQGARVPLIRFISVVLLNEKEFSFDLCSLESIEDVFRVFRGILECCDTVHQWSRVGAN